MAPGQRVAPTSVCPTSKPRTRRLKIRKRFDKLTHYVFRYPAKFHPPVVRALIESYTASGDLILDPFCGSGTLLVEARSLGRDVIGVDVDPVAVAVSRAKTHRFQIHSLDRSIERVLDCLTPYERTVHDYEKFMFADLTEKQYEKEAKNLRAWIPGIPNLFHWFRRYVVIDLARIRKTIDCIKLPETHKQVMRMALAAIIRNASNADPVPVSGLEVTSYMKRRDEKGRLVNPFALFDRRLIDISYACEAFEEKARPDTTAQVIRGDATELDQLLDVYVDAIITSPPYHGAVDYYRRHQLEMFWLGITNDQEDRLALRPRYIGRSRVAKSEPFVADFSLKTALAKEWELRIREISEERADAFRHYIVSMMLFFDGAAAVLPTGKPMLLVVGHSSWNNSEIPTTDLFRELAGEAFTLEEVRWYPVVNRYMSYSRHNNADINKEYVLVFRRTAADP